MASIAYASRLRAAYIAEVTAGITPATPTFQVMRVTGAGIRSNKKTEVIRELRADANVTAEVETAQSASAAYQFALSYGSMDDIIAAALRSSWTTNVVKNGTGIITNTFEEMLDFNGTLGLSRLVYGVVDNFSLDISSEKAISGAFSVLGQKETLDTAIIASATYTATNVKQPMSSGISVAALSVGSLSTPRVKRITIDIKSGIRLLPVIDSLYPVGPAFDLMDVTGTIEIYMDSHAAYTQVLAHGGGALAVTLGQTTLEKYTLSLPTIVFLDGVRQLGGSNADAMVSIPFRAIGADNSANPSISFTRAVA